MGQPIYNTEYFANMWEEFLEIFKRVVGKSRASIDPKEKIKYDNKK